MAFSLSLSFSLSEAQRCSADDDDEIRSVIQSKGLYETEKKIWKPADLLSSMQRWIYMVVRARRWIMKEIYDLSIFHLYASLLLSFPELNRLHVVHMETFRTFFCAAFATNLNSLQSSEKRRQRKSQLSFWANGKVLLVRLFTMEEKRGKWNENGSSIFARSIFPRWLFFGFFTLLSLLFFYRAINYKIMFFAHSLSFLRVIFVFPREKKKKKLCHEEKFWIFFTSQINKLFLSSSSSHIESRSEQSARRKWLKVSINFY